MSDQPLEDDVALLDDDGKQVGFELTIDDLWDVQDELAQDPGEMDQAEWEWLQALIAAEA